MKTLKTALTLLGLAVIATMLASPVAAQSDNPVVQATKEKATTKKARRVYTNEDFAESPQANASVAATSASPADTSGAAKDVDASAKQDQAPDSAKTPEAKADAAKPENGKADDAKADAKAKQNAKIKELEDKLAQAKKSEQQLRANLADLEQKASVEQSEFRRNMYLDMVSNQQVTLSEFRRTQEELEKQIEQEKSNSKAE
jgi:hypothetical protein